MKIHCTTWQRLASFFVFRSQTVHCFIICAWMYGVSIEVFSKKKKIAERKKIEKNLSNCWIFKLLITFMWHQWQVWNEVLPSLNSNAISLFHHSIALAVCCACNSELKWEKELFHSKCNSVSAHERSVEGSEWLKNEQIVDFVVEITCSQVDNVISPLLKLSLYFSHYMCISIETSCKLLSTHLESKSDRQIGSYITSNAYIH